MVELEELSITQRTPLKLAFTGIFTGDKGVSLKPKTMNKQLFFNSIRTTVFSGSLLQKQVDSINAILDECKANSICDNRMVAYILATAVHEVGFSLLPVREGFSRTNEAAIAHVTAMFKRGQISKNYALPEANGKSYYGRGYVQLTWGFNYKNAGQKLGIDLYSNPDLALHGNVAAKILVRGMKEGWFTGRKLDQYFTDSLTDYKNARRIVNGTDKADLIASYAVKFHNAMS